VTHECGTCGRPTDAYVCKTCAEALNRALGDCVWLEEELETTITRQRGAATEGGARGTVTSLPWHEVASERRRDLRNTLAKWALYATRHGLTGTPRWHGANTITSRSRWLLNVVHGLTLDERGPAAVDEITRAVTACYRVIDLKPEREWAGPCECGRDLYRTKGQQWVRCDQCGEQTDTNELLDRLKAAVWGRLVTAREGAGLLSKFGYATEQGTIDKWRERHKLAERGHNHKGHRLYLWDDLELRARKTAEKRAG
jgi:predicted amidophosphoribosyltransferase